MIGAYQDDAGAVGDKPRLPLLAEDTQDAARDVADRLQTLAHVADDLAAAADKHADAVDENPRGYTYSDVAAWRSISAALHTAEAALSDLKRMMEA